jgi:hypothetical protein
MSQNTNSETNSSSDGRLDPDYTPRGYPSKWDVSELCKPNSGRKAYKRNKKVEKGRGLKAADDSLDSIT